MLKSFLVAVILIAFQSVYGQSTEDWITHFTNDDIRISVRRSDCHYPEKGVHNAYLLFRLENLTDSHLSVAYDLQRAYNGKASNPDTNGFSFELEPGEEIASDCDHLQDGLHLFIKMLEPKGKSILSGFELIDLTINGKNIAR
ncbi:MAG: hypothetical protein KDB98_09595 [Flavobacteriales bacterium]|nr:hypothetical protein [Flavobacteriales bacterium]